MPNTPHPTANAQSTGRNDLDQDLVGAAGSQDLQKLVVQARKQCTDAELLKTDNESEIDKLSKQLDEVMARRQASTSSHQKNIYNEPKPRSPGQMEAADAAFWANLDAYVGTYDSQAPVQPYEASSNVHNFRQDIRSDSGIQQLKEDTSQSWFERKAHEWSGLGNGQTHMSLGGGSGGAGQLAAPKVQPSSSTWPSASKQAKKKRYRGISSDKMVETEALPSSAKTQKIGTEVVVVVEDYFQQDSSRSKKEAKATAEEEQAKAIAAETNAALVEDTAKLKIADDSIDNEGSPKSKSFLGRFTRAKKSKESKSPNSKGTTCGNPALV
jgi:hypothetical protein